jgi:hypothetical protein
MYSGYEQFREYSEKEKAEIVKKQHEYEATNAPREIASGRSPTISGLKDGLLKGLNDEYQNALLTCVKHFFNKVDPQH